MFPADALHKPHILDDCRRAAFPADCSIVHLQEGLMASQPKPPAGDRPTPGGGPLRIRKYANRRLYDQSGSRHLTNDELYDLVVAGHDVIVIDARTEEEITNVILAQLLIERDPLKLAAVPSTVLHALIRTNERMLQSAITRHLAGMLESMATLQRHARGGFAGPFNPLAALPTSGTTPLAGFPDPAAASMEWMRRLLGAVPPPVTSDAPADPSPTQGDSPPASDGQDAALRAKVDRLERQLDELLEAKRPTRRAAAKKPARDGSAPKSATPKSAPSKSATSSPRRSPAARSKSRPPRGDGQ